ncbi:MAG TPA: methionine adenosyltransferase, partial [Polyangiales bacterium]|nr:methionine adenosyltransferase [Polyangiales bacterium]
PDFVFSSESVTAGHPDKVCDQISDAIVDRFLRQDPLARVNAECAVSTSILFLSVKARAQATVDAPASAREVLRDVGYTGNSAFDARTCTIMTNLYELPDDPRSRVDEESLDDSALERITARDQATVFGYACRDTDNGMPLPIVLAHRLARRLFQVQRELDYLSPDGKTQVAVEYRDFKPVRIDSVTLVACQFAPHRPSPAELETDLRERVIAHAFEGQQLRPDNKTRIAINPDGPQVPGGPALHAGLTGRKTAVDSYGEFARNGAAALSGKDPSRIDRVGVYAARHAARHVVAAGLADRCEVQLSYSIGLARPVSVLVQTFGSGKVPDQVLSKRIAEVFDFRPAAIVQRFGLRSLPARRQGVFYRNLSAYGQVGRDDLELPWEKLDNLDALRR